MQRAIVVIQSQARKFLEVKRYCKQIREWRAAKLIQSCYKLFRKRREFKGKMMDEMVEKLKKFKEIQNNFVETFKNKQIT